MFKLVVLTLLIEVQSKQTDHCPRGCSCVDNAEVFCPSSAAVDQIFTIAFGDHFRSRLRKLSIVNNSIPNPVPLPLFDHLQYLDLSSNGIKSFNTPAQSIYPTVTTLILRANKFRVLKRDAFLMFPNVELIDLSHNELSNIDWEAFRLFKLKRLSLAYNNLLSAVNFANNMIRRFDYDSFSTLYQIEMIDLSFNELSAIPGGDLRQFIGLRTLHLDGNYFDRIADGDFVLPALQELTISKCLSLRLVERNAFSLLPSLRRLDLSANVNLVFISPHLFSKNITLHSFNVSKAALQTVSESVMASTSHINLSGNKLKCECIKNTVGLYNNRISDRDQAECSTLSGASKRLADLRSVNENCTLEAILPFGDSLITSVGEMFSMYCASQQVTDIVSWTFPNGTQITADPAAVASSTKFLDINEFININPLQITAYPRYQFSTQIFTLKPRISVTTEQLRFEATFAEDSGEYRCSVRRGSQVSHRTIQLNVISPTITLYALEVRLAGQFAKLPSTGPKKIVCNSIFNAELQLDLPARPVHATDRIHLLLHVKDATGLASRTIQLSLHNPWFSYNVMRLKPNQNYTFCLCYSMQEYGKERTLYETCADLITSPNMSFFDSLNLPTSRMNQSISGQSFLSSASSTAHEPPFSVTYENQLPISLNHTVTICRNESNTASSTGRRGTVSNDRLIAEDMAL
ncbi:unnamed protein product [Anisakis simplex]|uniref:Ig-like domain-containing protein n=1 Tax=Anisakis simplex TaxID=6269 RepID=A0A0M3JXP6_ANISI|nr:unnamed protein product [Anisakis simplex]